MLRRDDTDTVEGGYPTMGSTMTFTEVVWVGEAGSERPQVDSGLYDAMRGEYCQRQSALATEGRALVLVNDNHPTFPSDGG